MPAFLRSISSGRRSWIENIWCVRVGAQMFTRWSITAPWHPRGRQCQEAKDAGEWVSLWKQLSLCKMEPASTCIPYGCALPFPVPDPK